MTILFFVQPTLGIADAIEPTINQTKSKQNLSFQTLYCSVDFIQSCSCALCIIFAHISFGVLSAILNQNEQQRKGSEKYPNRTRSFSCRSIFQGFSFSASHSHSHTHSTKHKTHKSFTLHWIIPIEYCCCCIFASNPNNELKKNSPVEWAKQKNACSLWASFHCCWKSVENTINYVHLTSASKDFSVVIKLNVSITHST